MTLSQSQLQAYRDIIFDHMAFQTNTPVLVWIGNSHANRYNGNKEIFCAGFPGATLEEIRYWCPTPEIVAKWPNAKILITGGANEAAQGTDVYFGSSWHQAVKELVTIAMGNNRKVWLGTDPPTSAIGDGLSIAPAAWIPVRGSLESLARFDWTTHVEFPPDFPLRFFDLYRLLLVGDFMPTRYSSDGVHLSALGYYRVEQHMWEKGLL